MATTSPDNLWTPDTGDDYALTVDLAAFADTVQDALVAVRNGATPSVANQSVRDAIFPSPVQGNRVFRNDLGYEEIYLAAYNVTTNPGGKLTAGWTKRGPSGRFLGWQHGGTWNGLVTSYSGNVATDIGYAAGVVTIQKPGVYQLSAAFKQTSPAVGGSLAIRVNGTGGGNSYATSPNAPQVAYTGTAVSLMRNCVPGDTIQLFSVNNQTLQTDAPAINSYFEVLQVQ